MKKLALVLLLLCACDETPIVTIDDAGNDAGTVPDAIDIDVGDDAGATITGITMNPLVLVPPFSPDTHDYYVRCATGDNLGALTVQLSNGTAWQSAYDVVEDQAVVVSSTYWIRCLPQDFPVIGVTKQGTPTPGYYLVNGSTYGAVLDTNGVPVWYTRGTSVANVDSQATNTISLVPNGTAPYGYDLDTRFDIHSLDVTSVESFQAKSTATDAHELRVLPNGDRLVFTYPIESHIDLTELSYGSDEYMADCEIQEIDPGDNVVWSWLASDHVDPSLESIEPAVNTIEGHSVVDVFHCNSIEVGPTNDLLVSFRHANAIFDVDRASGTVLWKLGGSSYNKDGAETIVPDDPFNLQHDARFTANGDVTLYDDHGATYDGTARGVEYAIDHVAHTASLVFHYDGGARAQYEGSFRRYADGHSVIGWGFIPSDSRVITEIDESGNDVFDVTFTGGPSYRAVKVPLSQLDITLLRATAGL
jgi:hypothetical protein